MARDPSLLFNALLTAEKTYIHSFYFQQSVSFFRKKNNKKKVKIGLTRDPRLTWARGWLE